MLPRFTGYAAAGAPHVLRRESKRTTAVQGGPRGEDRGAHAAPRHAAQHYAGGQPRTQRVYFKYPLQQGTYVRVLLEDIGRALGVPATMAALRRTASGPYTLEMAYTLDELQRAREAGTLESLLLSVESVFTCLPAVEVNEETRRRLLNGAPTYRFPARDGATARCARGNFWGCAGWKSTS